MTFKKDINLKMFRNAYLEDDEWTRAISWGDNEPEPVKFHLEDPTLLVLEEEAEMIKNYDPANSMIVRYKKRPDGKLIDRFNLSEDWRYETHNNKIRIKQTHGQVKLMHSLPAVKLHTLYVS